MGRSKRSRSVLFVALAAIAPLAVACNAIIGIDDFRRTECGIGPCDAPDSGPDQIVFDQIVTDTGRDSDPDAPPGVGPVSWAAFKMPNYKPDSGAPVAPNPITYGAPAGVAIEDTVTGLVWRSVLVGAPVPDAFGKQVTADEARAECQKITESGPWRLPKRIELVTLLSHGIPQPPYIDKGAFPGFPDGAKVWTSSEVRPFNTTNGSYWAVDFDTGQLVQLSKGAPGKALCVRDKL